MRDMLPYLWKCSCLKYPFNKEWSKMVLSSSYSHRIRLASSPSGSLLLFFSDSFAFFFFFKLTLSFSLLVLILCTWWTASDTGAFDWSLPSDAVNRCLVLLPSSPPACCCCLALRITTSTTRANSSRKAIAMVITAHSHEGVSSVENNGNKWGWSLNDYLHLF